MSASQVQEVSNRLLELKKAIPSVFARSPRSLDEIERWKATEFRQFMLYTGKLVLKGIMRDDLYLHFMTFSVAMCILVSPTLVNQHADYAHNLLNYFVVRGQELYGSEFLVYNTHMMLHITADAVLFGGLDNCSAFMFETHLHSIKKMVRSGKNPLAQVAKRLEERQMKQNQKRPERKTECSKDQTYLLEDGESCEVVDDVEKDGRKLCRVYHQPAPLFSEPCSSFLIGVYKYKRSEYTMRWIPTRQIWRTAIMIQMEGKTIFIAVLHNL